MAQGVEVRHEAKCRKMKVQGEARKKARCSCSPSYRAWVFDPESGKPIKREWTKDKDRAESEAIDLRVKKRRGEMVTSGAPRFDKFIESVFLPGIVSGAIHSDEGEPYKPAVRRGYRSAFTKHLLPAEEFKNKRLDQIKRKDVVAFVDRKLREGYAAGSIHNFINPLRALYRYAIEREMVTDNPTRNVRLPKPAKRVVVMEATGERGEMVIRNAPDVLRMIDVLPEDERGLFAVAALAGLRRGELQALRVGHIDFAQRIIRVRLSWDQIEGEITLKSNAGRRDVGINKYLMPYLAAHVAALGLDADLDSKVFPGVRPGTVIDPDKYLARCRDVWSDEGIEPLGLHDARHTCASLLIASGANIKQISRMMGHSSISITFDTYGHLLPGSLDEVVAAMDDYLDRTMEAAKQ